MSTKEPRGKYGDAPPAAQGERRGAPLPLMTQPMIPLDEAGGTDAGATRLDVPMPQVSKPDHALSPIFAPKTVAMAPVGAQTIMSSKAALSVPGAAPPEIGLTQHHLPEEELDARLELVHDPDSERSAAYRILRHHLLETGRPNTVVVSSPLPGEGKTTTAVNLALALAECGRAKVLLVETHVRRPQLASVFKFVPPWCFAEQLAAHRHQPMMPWSLIEIPQLWLHIAAINPRIDKTQLLDGPAFAIAIERLRMAGYEHIVVDAPPVLGSADVNLMADAADTVIFALRARRSTTRDLRRAIEQLGANKVSGTVLCQ